MAEKTQSERKTFKNCDNYADKSHDFIMLGVPSDHGSTQDRGFTFNAPDEIRALSDELAYTDDSGIFFAPENIRLGDIGNVNDRYGIDIGKFNDFSLTRLNDSVSDCIKEIYRKNPKAILVSMGGNHYITYPVFSSIKDHYAGEKILLINFDAHIDYYDDWELKHYTHCTVMKRLFDLNGMGGDSIYMFGSRDNDISEIELARQDGLRFFTMHNYIGSGIGFKDFLSKKLAHIEKGQKIYISFDIDVFDPSVAPATGYPIPGGLNYREIHQGMEFLAERFSIIGFDLVEYQPNLDLKNKMTGFLCAKLLTEIMMMIKLSNH